MIRDSFEDVIIEPQRQALIPGFQAVKSAARRAGALGCSISGAGPTIFAWCGSREASAVRDAMVRAFADHQLAADHWISATSLSGASVVPSR